VKLLPPGRRAVLLLPGVSDTMTASSTCLRWPAVTRVAHTVTLQSVSRSGEVSCEGQQQR
jgi:hypothetical protein